MNVGLEVRLQPVEEVIILHCPNAALSWMGHIKDCCFHYFLQNELSVVFPVHIHQFSILLTLLRILLDDIL